MKKPPKPTHIVNNYKKEMKNMERLSEIQFQNRVLLRKMLQIDLQNGEKRKMFRNASENLKPTVMAKHKTIKTDN